MMDLHPKMDMTHSHSNYRLRAVLNHYLPQKKILWGLLWINIHDNLVTYNQALELVRQDQEKHEYIYPGESGFNDKPRP